MIYSGDLTGFRAIVRDSESGGTICDTKIIGHDKRENFISIEPLKAASSHSNNVSVLIFTDSGLYEYLGTFRQRIGSFKMTIALYEGKEKENRACKRYELSEKGIIENIVVFEKPVKLPYGVNFQVVNVSANGILIKALTHSFFIGSEFQIVLTMGDNHVMFVCEVVRIGKVNGGITEYGCKLLYAQMAA
ncbi:MAG: PilZ domain-containing protein [Firmicutes bacterium]|nr:PilZ domain-containing protein [Bacillota bacterium]